MRSRLPQAPPVQTAMSATTASTIQSQSIPVTPPGDTSTYIIVVHGATKKPITGQSQPLKPGPSAPAAGSTKSRCGARAKQEQ